ncbi:MAG: hypothetical protein IJ594_08925, partial [Oscillospiraceae bacterium]|nr:hypothetical protein [Oscillospiraceae bacterium]
MLNSILFALLFVLTALTAAPEAYAYMELKGSVAAESTELDRGLYADASLYENEPVAVKTVRIGLRYGESAVEDAQFINASGKGFSFGEYDSERIFHERGRTAVDDIIILC